MAIQILQVGALDDFPAKVTIETKDTTVEELLRLASEQTGIDLLKKLLVNGKLWDGAVILANGYSIEAQQGLQTMVKDGEHILISVLVAGG